VVIPLSVVALLIALDRPSSRPAPRPSGSSETSTEPTARPSRRPPPPSPDSDAAYAFTFVHDDGHPVRWNPCAPIRYVVNLDGAPTSALPDITEAFARLTAATGINAEYDGPTDEVPTAAREPYQSERYGDEWAPVLIAWVGADETDIAFEESTSGAASPTAVRKRSDGELVYVTGEVALNTGNDHGSGFDTADSWGVVILHELGHIVGLAHVDDRAQLMYRESSEGVVAFAAGDTAGLRQLGREAGCLTTPAPTEVDLEVIETPA